MLFSLVLLSLSATLPAAELSDADKQAFLGKLAALRSKEPGARADFHEEKQTRLLQKPLISEGSIAFMQPNKFRREIKGANPSLTVSNGSVLWIFYPKFSEAERYTLGQRAIFDDSIAALTAGMNFERLEEFYAVRIFSEGNGTRLVLTPKKANLKRILQELTVVLDSDYLLVRTELTLPKGDHVETAYTNVRRTSVPASEFEFTPDSSVKVSTPLGK